MSPERLVGCLAVTPDARSDQFAFISMNYDGTGFFGYVETTGGKLLEEGEWPTVEDALAWARARATMVRLIYGRGEDSPRSDESTSSPSHMATLHPDCGFGGQSSCCSHRARSHPQTARRTPRPSEAMYSHPASRDPFPPLRHERASRSCKGYRPSAITPQVAHVVHVTFPHTGAHERIFGSARFVRHSCRPLPFEVQEDSRCPY